LDEFSNHYLDRTFDLTWYELYQQDKAAVEVCGDDGRQGEGHVVHTLLVVHIDPEEGRKEYLELTNDVKLSKCLRNIFWYLLIETILQLGQCSG